MTNENRKQKIEELYQEAKQKILELESKQKQVIADYIKDLEQKKIAALKGEITNLF